MTPILLAVLAHVIADFPLQTSTMALKKSNMKLSGYLLHGLIVFGTLIILLQGYNLRTIVCYSLCIFLSHILIDILKNAFCKPGRNVADLVGFLLDQGFHLAALVLIWPLFDWQPEPAIGAFYHSLFPHKTVTVLQQAHLIKGGPDLNHFLAAAIVYVTVCFGGAILVRKILNVVDDTPESIKSQQKVGSVIGLMERVIILTLVMNDALGSIAFILTAKSLARFNELNDRKFAEYYLIGTLTSTAVAVCGGLFFKHFISLL